MRIPTKRASFETRSVLFEIRCSNFKATDQPDVTIRIVLHQVEHPLVVWNPFARFDDNRAFIPFSSDTLSKCSVSTGR
ncbi:MAG: hypothetical protein Ct9H300mP7_4970 [Verrucomicrobiota bacterium]|nr:MAG: hypothetical protein Ct9H300mP7_4970 [Verrucomicrobiota bacterium]